MPVAGGFLTDAGCLGFGSPYCNALSRRREDGSPRFLAPCGKLVAGVHLGRQVRPRDDPGPRGLLGPHLGERVEQSGDDVARVLRRHVGLQVPRLVGSIPSVAPGEGWDCFSLMGPVGSAVRLVRDACEPTSR